MFNWLIGLSHIFQITKISTTAVLVAYLIAILETSRDVHNLLAYHINSDKNGRGYKLRTYCLLRKLESTMKGYLNTIRDRNLWSEMTKFRITTHKLNIEMGCQTKPKKNPVENSICKNV